MFDGDRPFAELYNKEVYKDGITFLFRREIAKAPLSKDQSTTMQWDHRQRRCYYHDRVDLSDQSVRPQLQDHEALQKWLRPNGIPKNLIKKSSSWFARKSPFTYGFLYLEGFQL